MTSHDALQDVPDPTDWNGTLLPGLADVEAPLRCQVCKEFMTAPMMTSCGHTFCSACIRRYLAGAGICPACKTKDQEINLRKNKSMEEVVEAFQRARSALLEVAKTQPQPLPSIEVSPKGKKRSNASQESSQQEPNKRTRTSARIAKKTTPEVRYQGADLTEEKEDKDDEYMPPINDGLVGCPMCDKRMKEAFINRHLDDVHFNPPPSRSMQQSLSKPSPKKSPAQKPPQTRNRQPPAFSSQPSQPQQLPSLNYHLYNETKLRSKLRDLGIPTSGNKPMLEKRHREWLTLWNANCDATHPKSKGELLRQLNEWERAEERQFAMNHYNPNPREGQVGNKEFDRGGWARKHEGEFGDLVEMARANARRNKAAKEAAEPAPNVAQERPPILLIHQPPMGPDVSPNGHRAVSDEMPPLEQVPAAQTYRHHSPEFQDLLQQAHFRGQSAEQMPPLEPVPAPRPGGALGMQHDEGMFSPQAPSGQEGQDEEASMRERMAVDRFLRGGE